MSMERPDLTFNLMGEDDPIDDPRHFMEWLAFEIECAGEIAIDTETNGLQWWTPRFTRLVQFGSRTAGWAIPVDWYGKVVTEAMRAVRDTGCRVIMHNAAFDMHALESDGFPVPEWRNVEDTMLLHSIAEPHLGHGLKPLTMRLLGRWAGLGQDALRSKMNKHGWTWATIPVDEPAYWAYGVLDTCLTLLLWDAVMPMLDERQQAAYEREMAYRRIMSGAETRGLRVDEGYTRTLLRQWDDRIQEKANHLAAVDGILNPNANKQVEAALVDLGVEFYDFTPKTGDAKIDKALFARLVEFGGPAGDLAKSLVEYKQLTKWRGTYLQAFLNDVDSDGYLHPSIRTMGAKTGRSSITDPPMQTLPSAGSGGVIRRCIIPAPDHHLCSIDYAGQEARIFASYANEQGMLAELRRPGGDLHNYVASLVYGEDFTKQHRSIAKTVNFALLYGAGPAKLAQSAGVSEDEMTLFLSRYHQTFPGVSKFMNSVEQVAKAHLHDDGMAWVRTSGGRKVVADDNQTYALTNYLVQGSGADVLKDACIRLDAAGYGEYILLPVHDEILFQFPEGFTDTETVADLMADADTFRIPITVDVSPPLTSWGSEYE